MHFVQRLLLNKFMQTLIKFNRKNIRIMNLEIAASADYVSQSSSVALLKNVSGSQPEFDCVEDT